MMQLWIADRQTLISEQITFANSFFRRLVGWMGKHHIHPGEVILFDHCNSIHTFFMRFSIDVLFLDQEWRVLHSISSLRPNRISPIIKQAYYTVELAEGRIDQLHIRQGDKLLLR